MLVTHAWQASCGAGQVAAPPVPDEAIAPPVPEAPPTPEVPDEAADACPAPEEETPVGSTETCEVQPPAQAKREQAKSHELRRVTIEATSTTTLLKIRAMLERTRYFSGPLPVW
jgi:hypothetical protein